MIMSLTEEQKSFFANDYSNFWPFISKLDINREPIFHELENDPELIALAEKVLLKAVI